MSVKMHKSIPAKITMTLENKEGAVNETNVRRKKADETIRSSTIKNNSLSSKITVLDIERENRLSPHYTVKASIKMR
jgi:hypothetical protein